MMHRARRAWPATKRRAALTAWLAWAAMAGQFVASSPAHAASSPAPQPAHKQETRRTRLPKKPIPVPVTVTGERYEVERYLNIRAAGSPGLSPSGNRVGFLTAITGQNQIWWTNPEGRWPEQATFGQEPIATWDWSPVDEDVILFARDLGGNERNQLYVADLRRGTVRRLTSNDQVIHNYGGWSLDGRTIAYTSNERNQAYFDVYTMDLASGRAQMVLQQDGANYGAGFSPDGRWYVVARYDNNSNNNLYLVDLTKPGEAELLTPHAGNARYQGVAWRPDSRGFFLVSDQGREFLNLASYDLGAKQLRFLEESPWDVEEIALTEDGRTLATLTNEDGYGVLRLRTPATGRALTVPGLPSGVPSNVSFSKDGRRLALTLSAPQHNGDVWLYDLPTRKLTQVTRSSTAGIPSASFVGSELVHYKSFDGRTISAFLYRPPDTEERRIPVIINVHGGPEDQSQARFSALTQYFVNRGFGVIYPNVRGSTGYGKAFSHLDDVGKRLDSVRDLAALAQWLVDSGIAERDRIAVTGGSYGGYMTLAALAFHPDLWAVGVSTVGIANLKTFIANTGAWRRALRAAEYGDPEKDSAAMDQASPIHKVAQIKAPLMIIQGANDPRVPQSEADQMVEAIRARGGTVEYLLFPDEGHGLAKLPNRIQAYTKMADFMEKYLLAPAPTSQMP